MPPPQEAAQRERRWEGLDTLRAIAVGLVVVFHFPEEKFAEGSMMRGALAALERVGWAGVDLFLVLSGFLIANLLFQEFKARGRVDFARFWTRRAFKIYPQFYLMLGLYLVTAPLSGGGELRPSRIASEALFVQNYFPHIWIHTWSLALEEHFYFIIGLMFVGGAGSRLGPRWPALVLTLAAVCLGFRIANGLSRPFFSATHLYATHLRLDSLFIGSLIAYTLNFHREAATSFVKRHRWSFLAAASAVIAAGFWQKPETLFGHTVGLTLLAVGFSGWVATIVFGAHTWAPPLVAPIVFEIGKCSYAIYLWHMVVLENVTPHAARVLRLPNGYGDFCFYFATSIIAGVVLTRLVEGPALRYRDRRFPRRAKLEVPAGEASTSVSGLGVGKS